MVRSSVAGVTLLVLVSMVTPDLVCGGQKRGKDSRLTYSHTHFAHNQYYTPQTGGVRSMTFQKTPRNDILDNNHYRVQIPEAEFSEVNPRPANKPTTGILNSVQSELSDDTKFNDIKCNDNNSDGSGITWDKTSDVIPESTEDPDVLTHTEGPVVLTHSGPVRGLTLDKAHVFYGIPYAAPPVGPKRWAAPEPVSRWTKPYDATFPRPACMQDCAGEFSEECPHQVILSPPIT